MNTILILHGWGSCAKNWNRVRELLESYGYRVFVPDLPGFGQSPTPTQPWSIDDYVNWVENYCKKNNLSQFCLLGHSFGGSIATKFTIKYLKKGDETNVSSSPLANARVIQKLFLVGCAGIRKKTIKKQIIKKIAKFLKKFYFLLFTRASAKRGRGDKVSSLFSVFRKILYKVFIKSDYLAVKNSTMKETYFNIINEDISNQFSKISVPTVIIWGKKDKLTPLKDAYYIKEEISGAKLEILPDIFHNPQSENPELLVDKILVGVK